MGTTCTQTRSQLVSQIIIAISDNKLKTQTQIIILTGIFYEYEYRNICQRYDASSLCRLLYQFIIIHKQHWIHSKYKMNTNVWRIANFCHLLCEQIHFNVYTTHTQSAREEIDYGCVND